MSVYDKNETFGDILNEMRIKSEMADAWRVGYPESWENQIEPNDVDDWIDRLEAACKRVCAPPGDTDVLREALEVIVEIGDDYLEERSTANYPTGNMGWGAVYEMLDTARDALNKAE